MRFSKYTDYYSQYKKSMGKNAVSREEYYERMIEDMVERGDKNEMRLMIHIIESIWNKSGRPYYRIWPTILEAAKKTRVDVSLDDFKDIAFSCSIELPDKHSFKPATKHGLEMSSCVVSLTPSPVPESMIRVGISVDYNEGEATNTTVIDVDQGQSVEDCILLATTGADWSQDCNPEETREIYRLCILVMNLAKNGSDIVTPDLLNKHQKWIGTDRETEFHNKAKRRGKFGFDIGKEVYEKTQRDGVSPHFRSPHFATVWTGKGRSIPKFVLRTGEGGGPIMVNKSKIDEVPTGYYGTSKIGEKA
jgi:hypothetical protein